MTKPYRDIQETAGNFCTSNKSMTCGLWNWHELFHILLCVNVQ